MSGQWQGTSAPGANAKAKITVTVGTAGSQNLRLRSLNFNLAIATAQVQTATTTIYDGLSNGTVIASATLCGAKSAVTLPMNDMDLRATSGTLSIVTPAAGSKATVTLNAQGDYVQPGAPFLGGL